MTCFYLPGSGPDAWQWLLARPALHWKYGASAMSLAYAWENAEGWPPRVSEALAADPDLRELELLLAIPEHQVPLPGGGTASQTDLFVLARSPTADRVAIAVEGKVKEPFGDETVSEWRLEGSSGKVKRLEYLLGVLGLSDDERIGSIRYQLLHRTASAVIEAQRFGARHAVMLVHSFSEADLWLKEFQEFAKLYGPPLEKDTVSPVNEIDGVRLHLGWVSDTVPPKVAGPLLGPRYDRALALARHLHRDQVRKGTGIPYMSHLMAVSSLVLDDGGSEDEAIAALLHDAVEDQGGKDTLRLIGHQFGVHVAAIVDACSDTDVVPKPPWRARKEAYVAHLSDTQLPDGTLRVSLADKLHNARAILFDMRAGADVFSRFSASREETLWYYDALATTFAVLSTSAMVAELRTVVDELHDWPLSV
jgi:hypothetical protein